MKNVFYFLEGREELSNEFSEREYSHLLDVRNAVLMTKVFFIAMILLSVFLLLIIRRSKNFDLKNFSKYLLIYLSALTFFTLILFIFVRMNFSYAFSIFHSIFFKPETWIFDYDSLIIQLFPESYFINLSSKIFVGFIFELVFINFLLMIKSFSSKRKIF
jgi:integral membrane protein (TIGR01906 family)